MKRLMIPKPNLRHEPIFNQCSTSIPSYLFKEDRSGTLVENGLNVFNFNKIKDSLNSLSLFQQK